MYVQVEPLAALLYDLFPLTSLFEFGFHGRWNNLAINELTNCQCHLDVVKVVLAPSFPWPIVGKASHGQFCDSRISGGYLVSRS